MKQPSSTHVCVTAPTFENGIRTHKVIKKIAIGCGLAMLGGLSAAYLVARQLPFLGRSEGFVFNDAGVVLLAGALVCAVGVIDDISELDALTKLGGQVLAAGLLVALGMFFVIFLLPTHLFQNPLRFRRRWPVR